MRIDNQENMDAFLEKLDESVRGSAEKLRSPYKEMTLIYGACMQSIRDEGDIPDSYFDIVGMMLVLQAAEIENLKEDIQKLTNLIGDAM